MSGSFSTLAGLVTAAQGGGITLGGITLAGFELPAAIRRAMAQSIALHKFPGGARSIDTIGPDPDPIHWQGMMISPDAADRARALEAMCAAGQIITLSWDQESYQGILTRFSSDYRGRSWTGSYEAEFTLLPSTAPAQPTPLQNMQASVSAALGVNLADVATDLGTVQQSLNTVSSLLPGTPFSAAITAGLTRASSTALGVQSLAEGNVGAIGGIVGASTFAPALAAAGRMAQASAAQGFIGQALSTASGG